MWNSGSKILADRYAQQYHLQECFLFLNTTQWFKKPNSCYIFTQLNINNISLHLFSLVRIENQLASEHVAENVTWLNHKT